MVCVVVVSNARAWDGVWDATLESGSTPGAVCTVMQRRKRGVLVVLVA
jgi:hypothetical protein